MKILLFIFIASITFAQVKVNEMDTVTTTNSTDRFLLSLSSPPSKAITYYRLGVELAARGGVADSLGARVTKWSTETIGGIKTFSGGIQFSAGTPFNVPIATPTTHGNLGRGGDSLMFAIGSSEPRALATKQEMRDLRFKDFLPKNAVGSNANGQYDLGSNSFRWRNIYVGSVILGGGSIIIDEPRMAFGDSLVVLGEKSAEGTLDTVYTKTVYSPSGAGLTLAAPSGIVIKDVVYNDNLNLESYQIAEAVFDDGDLQDVTANIIYITVGECSVDVIPITTNPEWESRGGGKLTIINIVEGVTTFIDSGTSGGAGSMNLSGNFAMGIDDVLVLQWNRDKSRWVEVSRSDN